MINDRTVTQADIDNHREAYSADSDEDVREVLACLMATIDNELLGPLDDGDESADWFFERAIRRAADYARSQPCACTFEANGDPMDLCQRCQVIGCDLTEHRKGAQCRRPVSREEHDELMLLALSISWERPINFWQMTRRQAEVVSSRGDGLPGDFITTVMPTFFGLPVKLVETEQESTFAPYRFKPKQDNA
jgi:hypothetical protein